MELSSSGFITAMLAFARMFFPESVGPTQRPRNVPQNELKQSYDFIIVGAGASGSVLANRLTENTAWTVLVIEAGGPETAISEVPLLEYLTYSSEKRLNYSSVRQSKSCQSTKGICSLLRGRSIGGSTALNGMFYVRGNRRDYDRWEESGNKGWGFKNILKYYIKLENYTDPSFSNSKYHGHKGPFNVQFARYHTPLRDEFLRAGEEMGLKKRDYNGQYQTGIDYVQYSINGPSRESASKAYLNPIRNRKNLDIIERSLATKVIFDDKKRRRAIGVEYLRNGKKYVALAKKEVIVAAGTFDTPKLLMLSGVGPREELQKHSINLVKDLPVGRNLFDHVTIPVYFTIDTKLTITSDIWKTNQSIFEYNKYRQGPLTTPGAETMAFFNSLDRKELPNFQIIFYSFLQNFDAPGVQHKQVVHLNSAMMDTKSIGWVTLKSTDPKDQPLINPNYLSEPYEVDALFNGIKFAIDFMKTQVMSQLSPKLWMDKQPLCRDKSETEIIKCLLKNYSQSANHPVGTARMGPHGDKGAVVTPELMVKGFENLRVIDASVIPTLPRGNSMAPTLVVGEKGADIIKKSHIKS